MNFTTFELGEVLASFCNAARLPAPSSADPAVTNMLVQILKETGQMTVDLTKLQADQAKAISLLQTLPDLKAQLADLQAKLAAEPHDDPTVQAAVDKMAADLEAALPTEEAPAPTQTAPVDTSTPTAAPEPTAAAPADGGTAEPAPTSTAPAETGTDAPQGTETQL